jgi:hypothetical protein
MTGSHVDVKVQVVERSQVRNTQCTGRRRRGLWLRGVGVLAASLMLMLRRVIQF